MNIDVKFKMNYNETDKQRTYTISDVPESAASANTVREKAQNFNSYLSTATVNPVFLSTEGKTAKEISDVQIIVTQETEIEGV